MVTITNEVAVSGTVPVSGTVTSTAGANTGSGALGSFLAGPLTSTTIVPFNANRKWLFLGNNGANDLYIGIGQAAESGAGIRVKGNNGQLILDSTLMSNQAINGICGVGSTAVIFLEGT